MKIEDLKKDLEKNDLTYKGFCHDCSKPVEVSIIVNEAGQIEISGGAIYKVNQQYTQEGLFLKCGVCFAEDPILHNWKVTEVYSRAIGYLRPINQWNKGKKEEFNMRKEFANTKGM